MVTSHAQYTIFIIQTIISYELSFKSILLFSTNVLSMPIMLLAAPQVPPYCVSWQNPRTQQQTRIYFENIAMLIHDFSDVRL